MSAAVLAVSLGIDARREGSDAQSNQGNPFAVGLTVTVEPLGEGDGAPGDGRGVGGWMSMLKLSSESSRVRRAAADGRTRELAAVLWVAASPMYVQAQPPDIPDAQSRLRVVRVATAGVQGVEQWRSLVATYFPAHEVDKALRVLWCESKGDANAVSPYGDSGGFQIAPRWHGNKIREGESWFDPEVNVRVAAQIWRDQGWGPWPVCGLR